MNQSSGETQREAAALAESLSTQAEPAAPQQEQVVPVHVVQSIREELKAVKEENEVFKKNLYMMQWQTQSQQQQPAQPSSPFKDIDPEETVKVKDIARAYEDLNSRFESKLAEIKIAQKSTDYGEIIKKYLPLAAQEDPELLQDIQRSGNPYKAAYNAVKASKAYQDDLIKERLGKQQDSQQAQTPKVQPQAERVVSNARQSGSVSSIASNSTPSGQFPSFSNMSDEEFRQFKSSRSIRPAKVI
jgi:hypothetical protein